MVQHPAEYPWSSYRCNALGQPNSLIAPHYLYEALGSKESQRQTAYQALFNAHIDSKTLDALRMSANKAWVLGSDYFKDKIAMQLNRSVKPNARGGDRKSEAFRQNASVK